MDAFLDRFYEAVNRHLSDPSIQKRYTKAEKLLDLAEVEVAIWEALLQICGQESMVGRGEATVTLEDGRSFYPLPGNFRQFISMFRYNNGDRNDILGQLNTIGQYDSECGIEILSGERGFLIKPEPDFDSDQDWTLAYSKGPIIHHNATAGAIRNSADVSVTSASYDDTGHADGEQAVVTSALFSTYTFATGDKLVVTATVPTGGEGTYDIAGHGATRANTILLDDAIAIGDCTLQGTVTRDDEVGLIEAGTPGTDAGTLIKLADYYNGSLIRVYSGDDGWPQTRECTDYYYDSLAAVWIFKLRYAWSQVPTGTVKYETAPALPHPYDGIYAMDVAIRAAASRREFQLRAGLKDDRAALWSGCQAVYSSNTADRAPSRTLPMRSLEVDPYE